MKIKTIQFQNAVMKWLENDVLSKGTPIQQAMLTFVLLQGKNKINSMLGNLSVLSDNDNFELELLQQNMNRALSKCGNKFTIPYLNYNFDNQDLNTIFNYIRSSTNENNN